MRPPRARAAAWLAALSWMAATPAALAAAAAEIPVVAGVAELPPPPPHVWADARASLDDNRVHGNGLVSMPALQQYLDGLYAKLKASAGVPDWPGSVYISADTTLNAHASAAGNLFLHIALIQSAESEDEIYSVLAHEFAHVYLNHQATYETHDTAENLRFAGTILGVLAGKIGGTGTIKWGVGDTIGAANSLAHDALIPVWQRDVEQQADMAGVHLSMRAGYSYPAGFKTFLERLATLEARDAAAQVSAANAANAAANAAGAAVAGTTARKTHASAQERETLLTERVAPLLPRPRPAPRKAPWQAALRAPGTAEVLAHFALLPRIAALQEQGKHGEALKLAQKAASGATAGDATMLLTLQDAMRRTGASPLAQAEVLVLNKDWPERSWNALRQAVYLAHMPAQPAQAKAGLDTLFKMFAEPASAMPDMVAIYRETGDALAQTGMTTRCLQYASYRKACAESANTEQERARQAAQAKAREDQLSKNAADKVMKMLKWK